MRTSPPAARESAWPSRWLTAMSGRPRARAIALADDQADHHAADQAGPGGGGDRVEIAEARRPASASARAISPSRWSTCARAAISGTTPP